MRNINITFTGIDVLTDINSLPEGCEYGVLYTETPEGRKRYPSVPDIYRILNKLRDAGLKAALHVCGSTAKNLIADGGGRHLTDLVNRIQINGDVTVDMLTKICNIYTDRHIITQHNETNQDLVDVKVSNHSLLVDNSCGEGVRPLEWNAPHFSRWVGFAGGLSPINIVKEIKRINKICVVDYWVDMESGVRNSSDLFSVDLAQLVFDQINEHYYEF